jgi:hypothetical protein
MDDELPTTTRWLLARIATTLNVSPSYFFHRDGRLADQAGPTAAQCEEVVILFRAIKSPARRGAVLKLLSEMAKDG